MTLWIATAEVVMVVAAETQDDAKRIARDRIDADLGMARVIARPMRGVDDLPTGWHASHTPIAGGERMIREWWEAP